MLSPLYAFADILLPPLESSLARARRRNHHTVQTAGTDENRFESESDDFYRRIYAAYQDIAAREPQRVVTISQTGTKDRIHQIIHQIVSEKIPVLSTAPAASMQT